jgi:DNA-binding winged helix-turn-helix (wHTH) protein
VVTSLEFLILGPLEVRRGSTTLQLGSAKQRALLGVLLLHPNEAVSTARLVDELWGEHPPATSEKLVQGYVHALRKQLGDGVLETRAPGYRVAVDPGSLDLATFEELTSSARSAPLPESVELRMRALALWRGTPLANVVLEGSERHTVTRIGELRLTTQIEQIDAELALGRHAQLVGELEAGGALSG